MSKVIYHSLEKGVEWIISIRKTYSKKDIGGWTYFYLLPTIQYVHHDIGYKEDQSFTIEFAWLFWELSFSRHWGEFYKEKPII